MRARFLDLKGLDIKKKEVRERVERKVVFPQVEEDWKAATDAVYAVIEGLPMIEGGTYCFSVESGNADKTDNEHLVQLLVNLFLQGLIENEARDREARLSAPIAVKTNRVIMRDLVNKKTKIDEFSLLVELNGKLVYKF